MNARLLILALVPLGLVAGLTVGQAQDTMTPEEGIDVQARGPVHEAYAEPTDATPEPSPVIAKQPPDPINEMPPEQKPAGDDVIWIPGYWDWDADGSQYLWISGFWRQQPPGRKWVPGFWQEAQDGWQRVRGFWAPEDQEQLQYVPQPPETIEAGPSTPQPEADSVYAPGCWIYSQTRYFWRPGMWVPFRPGWVWVPASYAWTPSGCLFVEGYWDHPLDDRGLLFAPVRFDREVLRRDFTYVPSYAINSDFLISALFVRPGLRQYSFGDYFEEKYSRQYVPWVDYRPARNVVDANFAYYRHQFSHEAGWEKNLRGLYVARYNNEVPRPPRTLTQQTQVVQKMTVNRTQNTTINKTINLTSIQNVSVLSSLKEVHNLKVTSLAALAGPRAEVRPQTQRVVKLETVSKEHRTMAQQAAVGLHQVAQKRQQAEARLVTEGKQPRTNEQPKSVQLSVPKIPSAPHAAVAPVKPGHPPVAQPAPKRIKEVPPPVQPPKHQPPPRQEQPHPQPPKEPPVRPMPPREKAPAEQPRPLPKERPDKVPQPPAPHPMPRPQPPAAPPHNAPEPVAHPRPTPHPEPPASPPHNAPMPHPHPPGHPGPKPGA